MNDEDEEISSESSVLTDDEESIERYKVMIQAMQELSEAEKKKRHLVGIRALKGEGQVLEDVYVIVVVLKRSKKSFLSRASMMDYLFCDISFSIKSQVRMQRSED